MKTGKHLTNDRIDNNNQDYNSERHRTDRKSKKAKEEDESKYSWRLAEESESKGAKEERRPGGKKRINNNSHCGTTVSSQERKKSIFVHAIEIWTGKRRNTRMLSTNYSFDFFLSFFYFFIYREKCLQYKILNTHTYRRK